MTFILADFSTKYVSAETLSCLHACSVVIELYAPDI